jgi:predicted CoA-substrate-specific enzyme activase
MRAVGIDVGSRTIGLVVLEDGDVVDSVVEESSYDPVSQCRRLLGELECDRLAATGYGRRLAASTWECEAISEIKAVGLGARCVLPSCMTVLDIGGQDTKAIALDERGKVRKFEMNDRCAAGTGRFLEVMATALGFSMDDFVGAARRSESAAQVNSMCTVFAESEVVSMVARGAPREEVALGLHDAVARRTLSMLARIPNEPDVLFAGGVALNSCICDLIRKGLGADLHVPESPQAVAALGAALHASSV